MVSQVIGQVGVVRKQKQKVKVKQRRKQRMRDRHQVRNQVCPKISEISDKISGMALPPPPPPQINVEGAEGVKRPVSIQVSSEDYFCLSIKSKRKTNVWRPISLCEYCESQSSE